MFATISGSWGIHLHITFLPTVSPRSLEKDRLTPWARRRARSEVHGLAALLVYALPHLLRRRAGASEAEPEELPAAS